LIEEGEAWFLYLLPYTLIEVKENRRSLQWYEASVAAFMNIHWAGIKERYAGFRDDVMGALGTFLMDPVWWTKQDLSTDVEVSSVSAASFLYLKFLDTSELDAWIEAVFAIKGAHWEAVFVEWMDRFHRFYQRAMKEDGTFRIYTWMEPNRVDWKNSQYLMSTNSLFDFLPRENVERFIEVTKS
jgi:hypothetical protein